MPVHPNYVWVVQKILDLQLSNELLGYLLLLQQFLLDHLESTHKASALLSTFI